MAPVAATEVTGSDPSAREMRDSQISSLTGMRGLAALMVVVLHIAGRTEYPWLGVHGFGPIALFVLSGFLLYRPFSRWVLGAAPRPSLKNYSVRRILRIFPAYWVTLHVWYAVHQPASPTSLGEWVKDVTMLNTLQFFGLNAGLQQAWTLGTELTWYVVLPFLAFGAHVVVSLVAPRWRLAVHASLLLSSLAVSGFYLAWAHGNETWMSAGMWLPKYLACFAFGALVALVLEAERAGVLEIPRGRKLMGDPWLLPPLALVLVAVNVSEWAGPVVFVPLTLAQEFVRDGSAFALAVVVLLIAIFAGPQAPFVRFLSTRFMQATGRWSYGIYLWHLPLIILFEQEGTVTAIGPLGLLIWLVLVLPVSYLLGAASYAWVETPSTGWAKSLTAASTQAPKEAGGRRRR